MESNSVVALVAALSDTPLAPIVVYIPLAMAAAALLAAVLPHPAPGSAWAPARAALDAVAMNFGNAKNMAAAPPPAAPAPKTGA
jgi:hypothetical protein